jgi:hypothetical protein
MPIHLPPIPFLTEISTRPPESNIESMLIQPQQLSPIPLIMASTTTSVTQGPTTSSSKNNNNAPNQEETMNGTYSPSPQISSFSIEPSLRLSSSPASPLLNPTPTAKEIFSYLNQTLTTDGSLDDPDTAQARAYRLLMESRSDWNIETDAMEIAQTYSLLVLFTSTSGSNWTQSTGWTSSALSKSSSVCGNKNQDIPWYGVVCDDNQIITELALNDNNLVGTLPSEIQGLTALINLTLSNNTIFGVIPSSIGLLTDLGMFFKHDEHFLSVDDVSPLCKFLPSYWQKFWIFLSTISVLTKTQHQYYHHHHHHEFFPLPWKNLSIW